jgi:hypothetical protein
LGRPQVHLRGLQIGLVLHALQLQPVQVHSRDVAGFVAVLADSKLVIEVSQIILGQVAHGLGLQSLHECAAQIEEQSAFLVRQLRLRDSGGLLCALQTQFPLVLAFVQVADVG